MRGWWSDASTSLRALLRRPGSPAAIAGILAVGIGATTATFAVFNTTLFRPIPGVDDPSGIVTVRVQPKDRSRNFSSFSREHFVEMRAADTGLAGLTAEWRGDGWVSASPTAEPELIGLAGVAREYFAVLGLRMRLGRALDDDDVETPGHRVVVISERLWQAQFGQAPDVVGRALLLNGESFTIAGVVSRYRGWSIVFKHDLWLPMAEWPVVDRRTKPEQLWDGGYFAFFGRLRPGLTPEAVEPRLGAVFAHVDEVAGTPRRIALMPVAYRGMVDISQRSIETRLFEIFRVLSLGAFLLLALACANAANLLLVRSAQRRRELALRSALGGGRSRLLRLLVIESAELAAAAGGLGLVIAVLLAATFRGTPLLPYLPALDDIGLDARVLAFAAAISALTVVVFGLVPAWLATSVDPRRLLGDARAITRSTHWLRAGLVAVQVALSLALVVSAVVLYRSLANLRSQDLGFTPAHVVEFDFNAAERGYDATRRAQLYRDVVDRVAAMPGVERAAFSSPAPISTSNAADSARPWEASEATALKVTTGVVSPGYFQTLSIPLLDGRDFRPDEFMRPAASDAIPVVISLGLAQRLFGSGPAVGHRLAVGTGRSARAAEIVGVVGDVKWADLRAEPRPMIYRPTDPDFVFGTVVVRSSQAPGEVIAAVRNAMREIAPNIPLSDVGTLDADLDHQLVEERVIARLMGIVAMVAGLGAVVGLYAVVAHLVAERTRELGIRIALGAPAPSIARIVLRPVVGLTLAGAAIGVALVILSSKLIAARVYHISPTDPITVVGAGVALFGAALVAAWRPARRATKIDPVVALRVE
jgi:predicted permease